MNEISPGRTRLCRKCHRLIVYFTGRNHSDCIYCSFFPLKSRFSSPLRNCVFVRIKKTQSSTPPISANSSEKPKFHRPTHLQELMWSRCGEYLFKNRLHVYFFTGARSLPGNSNDVLLSPPPASVL